MHRRLGLGAKVKSAVGFLSPREEQFKIKLKEQIATQQKREARKHSEGKRAKTLQAAAAPHVSDEEDSDEEEQGRAASFKRKVGASKGGIDIRPPKHKKQSAKSK